MSIVVDFQGNMQFEGSVPSGHKVIMDAAEKVGGKDGGPKPSEMILIALGGCTGMDVVSLLKKFAVPFEKLSIELNGADIPTEYPKFFKKINIVYKFTGEHVDIEKACLAIEKSIGKYSFVRHSLVAEVEYTLEVNGEKIS